MLLRHPAIKDAAVVGKPNNYSGELPKAFVVLKDGANATTGQIQDFVKARKTRAKWLSGGVEFVNAIPKSASGKILRRKLKDRERNNSRSRL